VRRPSKRLVWADDNPLIGEREVTYEKTRMILVAVFLLCALGFLVAGDFRGAALFGVFTLFLVLRPLVSRRLGAAEDDYRSRLRNTVVGFALVGIVFVASGVIGLFGVISPFEGGHRWPFWIGIACGLAWLWMAERGFRGYRRLPK